MSQDLSVPRKLALVLLPCAALLVILALWQRMSLRVDVLPEETIMQAKLVLGAAIVVGAGLCIGFALRLRRQLRTRSRYWIWTVAVLYFLAAMFVVLRFGGWTSVTLVVGIVCLLASGLSIWGATSERQRTIEYTLFPKRTRRAKTAENESPPVKQGA